MATTKLNNIILATARRLKAPRTLATDDAGAYTSVLITEYVNRSIRDLLIENYQKYGEKAFMELFPDYVKTSGALTLVAGLVSKPSDCFVVVQVKSSTYKFTRIGQDQVEDIRSGADKIIIPSGTRPVWWEENGNINTLGITSGDIFVRYIATHQDIAPITSVTTAGKWLTGSDGTWVAATRTLTGTMSTALAASDKNKRVLFRSATNVYGGRIENYVSGYSATIVGDALPAGNLTAGQVIAILVNDAEVDATDLKLNEYWHAEIINRAVEYGLSDAKNNIVS